MKNMILSCGHKVSSLKESASLVLKSCNRKGERVVDYIVCCQVCADLHELNNEILYTEAEEKEWLNNLNVRR